MSNDAEYHRTFEKFSMGMWPVWTHNPKNFNYRGQDAHRKEQEDAHAKRVGAFYAHQRSGDKMVQVRVMPKHDQDFQAYATEWEDRYSTLTANWKRRVEPVVDDKLTLVGHYGWFSSSEILIPEGRSPTLDVQSLIDSGDPIFASELNLMPSHYQSNYAGKPEWKFLLMMAPDGEVVGVFGFDVGAGAYSTMAPWEVISIGRTAIILVKTGVRYAVKMVARRRAARSLAAGPTREAAEKAAATAAPAVPVQVKKVTHADMLAWEKQGGHIIQNHGPQLTRENLKARITGKENIPAPQMQPGGVKPADLRVWRGQREPAASKWASEEDMYKAIGEVIHKNLDHIRRATSGGGEVLLLRQSVGYKTGSGWVTSGGQAGSRAAFYEENLNGVTLIIRQRKNHVPTAKDPEGWYVHTAFPDRAL